MFWFDRNNKDVIFGDIRSEDHILSDGRSLIIHPDVVMDFRSLPFANDYFKLVVFDPPHLRQAGKTGWQAKKYGLLSDDWKTDIRQGFAECFRVLDKFGILIFKWNEMQILLSEILTLTNEQPLFGHRTGKHSKTHWVSFMK